MSHAKINHSNEPIRLFQSDFLEFFTHIHPAVVVILWLPVSVYFLASAFIGPKIGAPLVYVPVAFVAGLFLWTFAEYMLHRFVFHFRARTPWQERISFLFHGVHHAQPQYKTRLVMPPAFSIPMAALFYGLFYVLAGVVLGRPHWVAPLFAGFGVGYLVYDMIHYATHHWPMRWGYLKFLKRYHMQHHYKTPDQRFGVSSPVWDRVFGTMPADE